MNSTAVTGLATRPDIVSRALGFAASSLSDVAHSVRALLAL